ncbi:MAG: class I SAM-dependent methyltransferase, partial [Clostridiaceae bacterium]|nr:class I SAM-dependent methyltransferase [Clostridiaceae bacterium]
MSAERPNNGGQHKAEIWNNPEGLLSIEMGRYPHERALRKIVSDVFRQYVPDGANVFEVGAGTGYLKELIPAEYHGSYISSDYNLRNLHEGQRRRNLQIQQASAYNLPLTDGSQDCIVDMDAYDAFPDLQGAMNEINRVLKPDGTFIHFQVNYP